MSDGSCNYESVDSDEIYSNDQVAIEMKDYNSVTPMMDKQYEVEDLEGGSYITRNGGF